MPSSQNEIDAQRAITQIPKAIEDLRKAIDNLKTRDEALKEAPHVPVVVPKADDSWGVICFGCSEEADDYITVCTVGLMPAAPATLWPERDDTIIQDVLRLVRGRIQDVPSGTTEAAFLGTLLRTLTDGQ